MTRAVFPAYVAAFTHGARQVWIEKADAVSAMASYIVLLVMFSTIYAVMPVDELGVPGLTDRHLLWYFAVTEMVVVSSRGMLHFGAQVAEGRLTEMMQRPVSIMGLVLTRLFAKQVMHALFLGVFAVTVMPLVFDAPYVINPLHLPLFMLSCLMSFVLMQALAFLLGTVEVMGPYSRPASWIVSKFIFAFGGLFFPVMFFPDLLQNIVWMTPFPAVIYVPASFMLLPDTAYVLRGMAVQVFWIAAVGLLSLAAERRMICYVMERGD